MRTIRRTEHGLRAKQYQIVAVEGFVEDKEYDVWLLLQYQKQKNIFFKEWRLIVAVKHNQDSQFYIHTIKINIEKGSCQFINFWFIWHSDKFNNIHLRKNIILLCN